MFELRKYIQEIYKMKLFFLTPVFTSALPFNDLIWRENYLNNILLMAHFYSYFTAL